MNMNIKMDTDIYTEIDKDTDMNTNINKDMDINPIRCMKLILT